MLRDRSGVGIATALMLTIALPMSGSLAQSPSVACAPLVAATQPAVPGGNAALSAAQPGPGPVTAPVACWMGAIGQPLMFAAVLTLGDAAYASDDAGNLIAFDATTGTERWRYSLATDDGAGQVRGIAPGVGLVYAAGPDGLVALEVADGSRAWRYRVKSDGLVIDADGFFWPVTVGDSVFGVTSRTDADGLITRAVVAVDGATGDERWNTPLEDGVPFGPPSSDGSLVMLSHGNGTLTALDAQTGASVWSVTTGSPAAQVAMAGDRAFVGQSGGVVSARSTTDGSEVWQATMDSGRVAAVTAVGDTVYVNGELTVYALDAATGAERWRSSVQAGTSPFAFTVVPAVTADTVYVGTADLDVVRLFALDAATGGPLWHVDTEMYGAVLATVVSGGRLFVVAYDVMGSGGLLSLGEPAS